MKSLLFTIAAFAGVAQSHSIFAQLQANGKTNPVSYAIRTPTYDGPINDVTTPYVACNGGPNPTMTSPYIVTVTAGAQVAAIWRHTLQSGPDDVIDPSHKGPSIAYMKKVSNAATDTGVGSGWFKIQEEGMMPDMTWSVDKIIKNGGYHYITIPKCIANGQYLLRAELIALHAASSPNGAQLYMECAQINVVGGTGAKTPSTVSFPGAYKSTDPGLLFNLYWPVPTSYTIPGPPVFTC